LDTKFPVPGGGQYIADRSIVSRLESMYPTKNVRKVIRQTRAWVMANARRQRSNYVLLLERRVAESPDRKVKK
jgi:hypothetical protein